MDESYPPVIPPRQSSKRAAAESIEQLQASKKRLSKTIKVSRQKLTRNSSYNAEWVNTWDIVSWDLKMLNLTVGVAIG